MDDATKKALLINAVILAKADGVIQLIEKAYLKRFMEEAGITQGQARRWMAEAGETGTFQPVADKQQAVDMLKLMIGVAAADKRLEESEMQTLSQMAKAFDIPHDELLTLIKQCWQKDMIGELLTKDKPATSTERQLPSVALVTDGFDNIDQFVGVCPYFSFESLSLGEIIADRRDGWEAVVFHTVNDKEKSIELFDRIKNSVPDAKIIAVVPRSEAFLISYLLERGIHGCLVEPVYPNEFQKLLEKGQKAVAPPSDHDTDEYDYVPDDREDND